MHPTESGSEAIINRLDKILERIDKLEARLEKTEKAVHELPGIAATAINGLDELVAPLRVAGSEWPERLPALLEILEQLTQPPMLEVLKKVSSLAPTLGSPAVLEAFEFLAHHADQFAPWIKILADVPGLLSTGVNGLDETVAHLKNSGVDIQERGRSLIQLVLQATDPRTLQLFSELLHQRETLLLGVHAMRDLPGILSMAVDSLDEFYRNYDLNGHDLGDLFHSLRRGILDIHTVSIVASAGEALADSERDYQPASLFQMLKALGEPEFRSTMGFLLSFVRHFSHSLQAAHLPNPNN
jgi:DNA-binding transcriptional ArsR family regulator